MHIFKKFISPICLPFWWQDLLLLIPRFFSGWLMAFNFGASKFGMPWSDPDRNLGLFEVAYWFPEDVKAYGSIFLIFPAFFAWMGAFSEAVGGLFLMVGLCTRFFSILIFCTMLVAIFFQQLPQGIWNALPAFGFLWVALFNICLGSGRFGIDFLITKYKL